MTSRQPAHHATDAQKIEFIGMLKGGAKVRAAMREIGLSKSTAYRLKDQLGDMMVEFEELNLGVPSAQQVIKRKVGSGAMLKITIT
jgi:hypothetical protein